jgi:hypothetical protein
MTFKPGESGNPAGRAVGSRNKKTLAAEEALFDHAQELVEDVVRRAKAGEPAAMRLCMERILPAGRGRPLPIELPPVRNSNDAYAAAAVVMEALKEGAISAREAVDLLRVVEGLARLTGTVDFIRRIARKEVARAAATLGVEHFFPGRPGRPEDEDGGRSWERGEPAADKTETADEGWTDDAAERIGAHLTGRTANGGNGSGHADDGIAHQDIPPDQRVSLQILADSTENGGRRPQGTVELCPSRHTSVIARSPTGDEAIQGSE